jgi:hypothetical protein
MTMDEGQYGGEVAESVKARDTRPDLKTKKVIINLQVRIEDRLHGWKEYVDREEWEAADRERRTELMTQVAQLLLGSMDSSGSDQ